MIKLVFYEHLPALPQTVWSFITNPQYLNTWSTAFIETLELGDNSEVAGIGATRQVTINTIVGNIVLKEVIEDCQPPHKFVYRVFQGNFIRYHRGEIQLIPQDGKTLLKWDVEFEFFLPILPEFARIILDEQITRSLKQLAEVIKHAPEKNVSVIKTSFDENKEIPQLLKQAEKILQEQRIIADRLRTARDPKYWFTRVYEYVTEYQLQACREGRFNHQEWVLRLIPQFHKYYSENLMGWMDNRYDMVESQWRRAFQAMENGKFDDGDTKVFAYGLMKGVEAHIEEDLPRALAEIYLQHYSYHVSYARFRADYVLMGDIFYRVANRLNKQLPDRIFPNYMKLLHSILPIEIQGVMISKYFYNIPERRLLAFERGERLVNLITESLCSNPLEDLSDSQFSKAMEYLLPQDGNPK